ncbi:hypothetical protein [Snodgrassella sp. CFCC 13594]|uniref:hypothetical protein n=1 Tax=Snodgrassella sp. CFCC 13594 TaxID=1775559 RepID=UPI000A44FC76|nr:hypothetical protein [Snodgrassella sp. CFCC 13594]
MKRILVKRLLQTIMCLAPMLSGCGVLASLPGVTAGVAISSATSNPAVGLAVATATNAAVDSGIKYVMRRFTANEQQQIANAIGQTAPGYQRTWSVKQAIPYYGRNQGRVVVVREAPNALTTCKQALFSVEEKEHKQVIEHWFTLDVCQNGAMWQWAQSEPAVSRWGALQ